MKVTILDNPLIVHKLSILRDKNTGTKEFRELVRELSIFLCYEAMYDARLDKVTIETPITKMSTYKLNEDNYAFLPILRAGTGMLEGLISVIPNAKIGHIGMYRDEKTFEPVDYFFKVPESIENREVIILDPMLATGGSAIDTIKHIKNKGVKKIKFLCIIAAPEGIKAVNEEYPDVEIFTTAVDKKLNKNKYIVPGLGDAGDRIFGTR
ncbi:MAG: uracil phosphoribosyltransferase [Bacilli bacterium]|nr:uracil phosphoribosyltransferase [Bacilli bacterium]